MVELEKCPICGKMPELAVLWKRNGEYLLPYEEHKGAEFKSGKYFCRGDRNHMIFMANNDGWGRSKEEAAVSWNRKVERYHARKRKKKVKKSVTGKKTSTAGSR